MKSIGFYWKVQLCWTQKPIMWDSEVWKIKCREAKNEFFQRESPTRGHLNLFKQSKIWPENKKMSKVHRWTELRGASSEKKYQICWQSKSLCQMWTKIGSQKMALSGWQYQEKLENGLDIQNFETFYLNKGLIWGRFFTKNINFLW